MDNLPKIQVYGQSLLDWCNNNSEWGQKLLSEWNYELNNSIGITPDTLTKSSEQKVYWTCEKGHTWLAMPHNRTNGKTGCPYCVANSTSYAEQFIYWALKQIYPHTENRCKVLKSPENPYGIEFDIGVPDIPLCIEYSPTYWHDDRLDIDNHKLELCKKHNVRFIQIIEESHAIIEEQFSENYIYFNMNNYAKKDEKLICVVDFILKSLGHSISEVNIDMVKKNAWEYSHGKINIDKALITVYPELAKEWHPTLNGDKTPDLISYGSHHKIYWQCTKCDYGSNGEWVVSAFDRTNKKTSCPCCNYNWFNGDYNNNSYKKAIPGVNDIQTLYPELAKEWHPTLNDTTPDNVRVGSNIDRYWQCTKCGYGQHGEWFIRPSSRCNNYQKSGCPNCRYNWFDDKVHKVYNAIAKQGVNDLASKYPELAKEWHPTLNDISIHEIPSGSHTKVYWQCTKCGYGQYGEWMATPNRRSNKNYQTGCPKCRYKWYKVNNNNSGSGNTGGSSGGGEDDYDPSRQNHLGTGGSVPGHM